MFFAFVFEKSVFFSYKTLVKKFFSENFVAREHVDCARPGARGGILRPCPPNHCLCPFKRELYPTKGDCAPKKLAGSVILECSLRSETPKILVITPELVSKNCFFVDFTIKTVCFCGFIPEFMNFRVFLGLRPFLGLYPRFRRISRRTPLFFWSTLSNSTN